MTSNTNDRTARLRRETRETRIEVAVNLDGSGVFTGGTGVGFFDHMLTLMAKHAAIDLEVNGKGDLEVECHHLVEDTGILLGRALTDAAGSKEGIARYGHATLPMEEALCECALDFCGRPYLFFSAAFDRPMIGEYATEVTEDFFRAVANNAGLTLHLECRRGRNAHHIVEGLFKSFARALRASLARDPRSTGVPSTKGTLD